MFVPQTEGWISEFQARQSLKKGSDFSNANRSATGPRILSLKFTELKILYLPSMHNCPNSSRDGR